MSRYTGNVQFEAFKLNVQYYTKTAIKAEQMILSMWPTILHLLSLKQHSMIRVARIPHISPYRYEEKTAHQGRESKYTCTLGGHIRRFPSCAQLLVSPCGAPCGGTCFHNSNFPWIKASGSNPSSFRLHWNSLMTDSSDSGGVRTSMHV